MDENAESKHAGGRPLKYETAELLQSAIDAYLSGNIKPTLAGLAVSLEIDRQTLYNYKERDEFFDILKKARAFIESKYEERLIYDGQPTGVIFALKNMGWSDRTDHDITTGGQPFAVKPYDFIADKPES